MQEVLIKEYNIDKRAYSELYAILQMLGKEYIDKIPEKIYKTIEKRKDDTYNPIYNDMEEVLEGRVKRKTVSRELSKKSAVNQRFLNTLCIYYIRKLLLNHAFDTGRYSALFMYTSRTWSHNTMTYGCYTWYAERCRR